MLTRLKSSCLSLTVALAITTSWAQTSQADIDFDSAIFQNTTVTQNDALGYAITADILEGAIVVGELEAAVTYGVGTNPFNSGSLWGPSAGSFAIFGESTGTFIGSETASGDWDIKITPTAGWQVDGISIFSQGSTLANPDFTSLTSNGVGTIFDSANLITNYTDGQSFTDGDDLLFAGGSTVNGIPMTDHSMVWAFNSEGATDVSFTYTVGNDEAVSTIALEGLRVDAQFSAVPEPGTATITLLALSTLCLRRRRK